MHAHTNTHTHAHTHMQCALTNRARARPHSITVIPALRYSFIVTACGSVFERSLDFHRVLGFIALVLTFAHGIWMLVAYCGLPQGCMYIFAFRVRVGSA